MRLTHLFAAVAAAACATVIAQPAEAQEAVGGYAALGDSYAAGVGTADYIAASGECYRSNWAHPAVWAAAHKPAKFSFAARSGATTADVINNQLDVLDSSTSLVTITVGGNDAGFTDVLTTCTLGDDQTCVDRTNQAKLYALIALPGHDAYRPDDEPLDPTSRHGVQTGSLSDGVISTAIARCIVTSSTSLGPAGSSASRSSMCASSSGSGASWCSSR